MILACPLKDSKIVPVMNKDIKKQLKVINDRLEVLTTRWNKQYDQNIQELLQLSTLLVNLETMSKDSLDTNKALLRK
jgi:hypothetical protein